eukprot:SAG31_NODE_31066_length_372_cov_1.805861_1_plen_99_part_10
MAYLDIYNYDTTRNDFLKYCSHPLVAWQVWELIEPGEPRLQWCPLRPALIEAVLLGGVGRIRARSLHKLMLRARQYRRLDFDQGLKLHRRAFLKHYSIF